MSTQTVKQVMSQRLTRGTPVIVAESFGSAKLRGKKQIVTSKSTVKCNGKGRCAGDWCCGLAVFIADPKSAKKDKQMGWRANTTKVCLTHLKDGSGVLILPPPLLQQGAVLPPLPSRSRLGDDVAEIFKPRNGTSHDEVSWSDLADAHRSGNIDRLALLARGLKAQSEELKSQVIASQARLIEQLTRT